MSDEVIITIIGAIATVLTAVVSAYGALALAEIRRKVSIEADAATDRRVIEAVLEAIHYAEEQARKAVDGQMSGAQKLTVAKAYARELLARSGLPVPADLSGRVEAALSAERSSFSPARAA